MKRRWQTPRTFILWGAIISILLAWLCVFTPGGNLVLTASGASWPKGMTIGDYQTADIDERGYGWDRTSHDVKLTNPDRSITYKVRISWRAGWPLRAMWAGYSGEHATATIRHDELGIPLRPWTGVPVPGADRWLKGPQSDARRLPLIPLPGLIVNAMFWGAALWLVVRGPRLLRGGIRARRGLCPACAYPMGASPLCSECGKDLPKRRRPPVIATSSPAAAG